jgi:crotonobetaine/carnitine-CoA ligase
MTGLTISSRLYHQALKHGDNAAVIHDDGTITWRQLLDHALRMSAMLRAQGIGPGDRVALLCGNRPAFLMAWFAIANIGAITVSVNTGLIGESLRYALTQSDASAMIIEAGLLEEKAAYLDDLPGIRTRISFTSENDLLAHIAPFSPDAVYQGQGSDPVSIIYTSGTTGRPKGVLNCHEAFLASGRQLVQYLNITANDRIMVFLPLFHTNPQMYAVMSALETGCAIVLRPRFSVTNFFSDARRFGCTMFTYVGTVLSMLTSRIKEPCRDHPITRCMGGGCPASVWSALEDRFGITPYELYGMTEIGGWVTCNREGHYRFGSCGKTRPDASVRVVDAHDNPVPPGTPGEIVVRPENPFIFLLGYWNDPATTWESSRNLWFHTGDVGVIDKDGYLFFQGRLKEIIRRGGENISPFEIEIALLEYPAIRDAAVVPVPDDIYGEEIKAVVVCAEPLVANDLLRFLRQKIPAHMIPRYLQYAQTIPRTETQKIQRHLLVKDQQGVIDLSSETHHA